MRTQNRGVGDKVQAKELRRIDPPQVGCNSSLIANPESVKSRGVTVISTQQNIQGYPMLINSQPSSTMINFSANRGTRTRGKGVELFYPNVFSINPNGFQRYRKPNNNIEYVYAYEMNNNIWQDQNFGTGLLGNYYGQVNVDSGNNISIVLGLGNISFGISNVIPDLKLTKISSARHSLTSKIARAYCSFDFRNDFYNDNNMSYPLVTNFLTFTYQANRGMNWNAECTSLLGSFAYTDPTRNRMHNLKKYIKTKLLNFLPYKK